MMSIYQQYFEKQLECQKRYGPRTVVLMQIGSFYEIYEYDPDFDPELADNTNVEKIGYATEIAADMDWNLHLCRKGKPHSLKNPNTVGCPKLSYEKENRAKLLQNNWTIVRVDQREVNNKIERFEAEVASPATEMISDMDNLPLTNYIVSIYIEVQKSSKRLTNYNLTCGVSAIDVTTGKSEISEFYSQERDPTYAIKEIYRYLITKRPQEVIINLKDIPGLSRQKYSEYLTKNLKLDLYPIIVIRYDDFPAEIFKLDYQKAQLSKVFNNLIVENVTPSKHTQEEEGSVKEVQIIRNNIINDLDLERMSYGRLSYILLLNYVYEHNTATLGKMQKPSVSWLDEKDHLVLTHNAIVQSNIYPESKMFHRYTPIKTAKKSTSLFEIINQTSTKLGQRKLQNLLYNPMTNVDTLENSYKMVEEMINDHHWKAVEECLRGVPDLDRLHRSLVLRTIQPCDLAKLFLSYIKVIKLYTLTIGSENETLKNMVNNIFAGDKIQRFNTALQKVWQTFDLEKLKGCKIEGGTISGEISFEDYPLLKNIEVYHESLKIKEYLNTLANYLNENAKGRGRDIEFNDNLKGKRGESGGVINTSMGFVTSKTKAKNLKALIDKGELSLDGWGVFEFDNIKDGTVITSSMIRQQCINYDTLKNDLKRILWEEYKETVSYLSENFDFYENISQFVATMDCIKSHAKSAIKFKYYKPTLDTEDGPSYIKAIALRHPLVEQIRDEEYIPNDITIGSNPQGILLYGANQAGKSTLTKSVGLAVIMAQIGGFTAGQVTLRPYHKIITRLTGNDDIIEGKSSFVVELSEVLTIERNMDRKTLVLGDELCRGTESASGTSITITMIELLVQNQSSYIFSTHMHNLVDQPEIIVIPKEKLKICHLQIYYDASVDNLIYNRKLEDGAGESNYGLETAKYLGFSNSFIDRAMEIRRNLLKKSKQLVNPKKSKYNSRVYMDHCAMCKTHINNDLETHHIKEQNMADENGFIDHTPKNSKHNLIVLCKNCHQNIIHRQNKKIEISECAGGSMIKVVGQ